MINQIKKIFNVAKEEAEEMKNDVSQELSNVGVVGAQELADLKASFASQAEQLADLIKQRDELSKELKALADAKVAAETAAKLTKLNTRKEALVAAIGSAKAEAVLGSTESLDDTAFKTVLEAFGTKLEAEADTKLFKEVGVSDEGDAEKAAQEITPEERLIKEKYGIK